MSPSSTFRPAARGQWRAEALARRLVALPSETGTPEEAAFAEKLAAILREIPYFRDNPQDLHLPDSHGSPMRRNVVALVRGKGERALILTGHYDTVPATNYGALKPLARRSDPLRQALIADLAVRDCSDAEALALADLQAGTFLPGRGMLDMKSGVAAAIAVLERFAEDPDRQGNLILAICPDEERMSRGIRALRGDLPGLLRRHKLRATGAINMDVTADDGDGSAGRAIHAGSIGKLMPFALVAGQGTHAGYPFGGVNAQMIVGEILRGVDANPALADRDETDLSPPPVCLEMRDLREGYDVTTPERAWIAFNWLYHATTPGDLLSRFAREVQAGMERAREAQLARARGWADLAGGASQALPPVPVLTCAQVAERAERRGGAGFAAALEAQQRQAAGIDDPLAASRHVAQWLWQAAGQDGPGVMIGFAGLHYPRTGLDPAHPDDAALRRAIEAAIAPLQDDPARRLHWRPHFQGISDMSFFGRPATGGDDAVRRNTPAAHLVDAPPEDAIRCPMVNIGPWGRDMHQRLERVHAPYAFDELPRIIAAIADRFLAESDEAGTPLPS